MSEEYGVRVHADCIQLSIRDEVTESGDIIADAAPLISIEFKLESEAVEELTKKIAEDYDQVDGGITIHHLLTSEDATDFAREVTNMARGDGPNGVGVAFNPDADEAAHVLAERFIATRRKMLKERDPSLTNEEIVNALHSFVRKQVDILKILSDKIDEMEDELPVK